MDKKITNIEEQLELKRALAKEACELIKEKEELLTSIIEHTIIDIKVSDEGNIILEDEFFGEEIYELEEIASIDKFRVNGDVMRLILNEREDIEACYGRMPSSYWIEKIGLNHYSEKRVEEIYNKLKLIEYKSKSL